MKTFLVAGVALSALAISGPAQAHRVPVDEGGDTAPCVTYTEYLTLHMGESRGRVRRSFDTDGTRTSPALLDAAMGAVPLDASQQTLRPKHRAVRLYPGCPDPSNLDGAQVFVEFNTRRDSAVGSAWL